MIAPPAKSKGKGKGKKMLPKVKGVSDLLWCAGEVIEVSDATTVVKGRALGAGHVYVRHDPPADEPDAEIEEDWFQIRTSLYGTGKAGSWRLAKALTDGVGAGNLADLSKVEESDESDRSAWEIEIDNGTNRSQVRRCVISLQTILEHYGRFSDSPDAL